MPTSIPRNTLNAQLGWAENFLAVVGPAFATYGLTLGQVATVTTLVTNFRTAFDAAGVIGRLPVDPGAYTQPARATLYGAAQACIDTLSAHAVTIQASITISDAAKIAAGITPRNFSRTPRVLPVEAPVLSWAGNGSTAAIVRINNLVAGVARPPEAIGTELQVAFGAGSPVVFGAFDSPQWTRRRNYWSRVIDDTVPYLKFRGRYIGTNQQKGPWSSEITAANPNFPV